MGQSSQRLKEELNKASFTNFETSESKAMPEIVELAKNVAKSGDSVVLSPGFPSFDMFKNFADRGQQFKDAVQNL
jgi:UDP-N-acetylmuramoylalanine--D-glutamate ligase